MGGTENFYEGGGYLDPATTSGTYGANLDLYGGFNSDSYRVTAGSLGFPSDPTTANQVDSVSKKLSTGAKTVEVSGVNIALPGGTMGLLDAIPKQSFKEINRLKKLAGADLTFHGPLVELSGLDSRGAPFEEADRLQAEREMFHAVQKGHELEPDGNIPIVFHAANTGFGETEKRVKNPITGKEEVVDGLLVDQETGSLARAPPAKTDYFKGGEQLNFNDRIKKQNQETWERKLQGVNFSAEQAFSGFERAKQILEANGDKDSQKYLDFYKDYVKNPVQADEYLEKLGPEGKVMKKIAKQLTYADIYFKSTYNELKDIYNEAYAVAQKSDPKAQKLLDDFRKKAEHKIHDLENDPSRIEELGNLIIDGVNTLRKVEAPQTLKPLTGFMIDKASDTVSNVAMKSFDKFGKNSPVIAIENPPADRFPLSRADEIVDLVESSRKKFTERATAPKSKGGLGLSHSEAKKQAEKLIGVTWDTAHINLIQGKGYTKKDVVKEAEKIAPYVKHVHISDNFGLGDTELPAGMGNSPIPEQLKLIEGYNKQVKKIVETGSWYSALKFKNTPMLESVSALGSPVYSMKMAPYWNQLAQTYAPYFSGIGATNPQFHHSVYGAGYSNIPVDLGGQMAGQSRTSGGTPFE